MFDSLRHFVIRGPLCLRGAVVLLTATTTSFANPETVLFTGSNNPLLTIQRELEIPDPINSFLTFRFGFATEEIFEPGDLFDSFSVLLSNPSSGAAGFVLTADASGILWAPTMEGGFQLDPGTIVRTGIPFANVQPNLPNQFAYEVSFALPEAFAGDRINLTFDLFDNQNTGRSLGYFSELMVIPEPSPWAILGIGGMLAYGFTRYFKKQ